MSAPERRRAGTTKPAPRLRKADRKRQLLAHARQLFLTHGYRETSTATVARAAGMSELMFRRHFSGKPALFAEVLHEIRSATVSRWREEAAAQPDPLAKLHAVADDYLATARDRRAELRVLHRTVVECDEPEVLGALRALYLDVQELLAEIIREGQQTGVFRRSLDANVGAWELIRSGLGYALTLPLGIPLFDEPDYPARAVECLLHCLLKTDV